MNPNDTERMPRRRLSHLAVHFISLVQRAANRRRFVAKSAEEPIQQTIPITKMDEARRVVYGIVYAPDEVDTQGDTMGADEIEKAAYDFMRSRRTTAIDADHDGAPGRGYLAESWLVRKGDPLFPDDPEGSWAVGIKVTDEATWERIVTGALQGLSMAGTAQTEPIERAADPVAIEALRREMEALALRLEAVEKHTPGRQTVLGDDSHLSGRTRGLRIL